jgi:hypothetical protein
LLPEWCKVSGKHECERTEVGEGADRNDFPEKQGGGEFLMGVVVLRIGLVWYFICRCVFWIAQHPPRRAMWVTLGDDKLVVREEHEQCILV